MRIHHFAAAGAVGFGLIMLSTGCPAPDDGGSEGEGSGEGEGEGPPPSGESCAEAILLEVGTVSGDLTGAVDDVRGGGGNCFDLSTDGPDRVYRLELAEDSGIRVIATPSGGADITLNLYNNVACDEASAVAGACQDVGFTDEAEELNVPILPAGTYFLAVDTFLNDEGDGAGPYELDVTVVPGGQCAADEFEDPDNSNQVTQMGGNNFSIAGTLCDADKDGYVVAHNGGFMNIDFASGEAGTLLRVFDLVESTTDVIGSVHLELGGELDASNFANGAPAGFYLFDVERDPAATSPGTSYTLDVEHGCAVDIIDLTFDPADEAADNAAVVGADSTLALRTSCADDIDRFHVRFVAAGDMSLRFQGGAGLTVASSTFAADGGAPAATVVESRVVGADLVVTFTSTSAGDLFLALHGNSSDQVDYVPVLDMTEPPPANDSCAGAVALTIDGPAVAGQTFSAVNDIVSACSSEDPSIDALCNDTFYALHLDALTNVELTVTSLTSSYNPTVELLAAGTTCDQIAAAGPVGGVCNLGVHVPAVARYPQVSPGDYLIVVDGQAVDFDAFGIHDRLAGEYTIEAHTFVDTGSCSLAEPINADGTAQHITLTDADLEPDQFETYTCGFSTGGEQVFVITPLVAGTLHVFATVIGSTVELHKGSCLANEPDAVCGFLNDSVDLGSFADMPVVVGDVVFAFVDHSGEIGDGASEDVTIVVNP